MSKFSDQHNNKQYISERFIKSMTVACLAGSLLHLFLSVFYFIIKVPEMCVYAIVSFFLYGLWRQLFKNKWIKPPFILGSLNAITGIILANYFIGWDSNFNIYFIILPAALLLYTGWKAWERSLYLILLT